MRAVVIAGKALGAIVERALAPHGFTVARADSLDEAAATVAAGGCALVVVDCDGSAAEPGSVFGALAHSEARHGASLLASCRDLDPSRIAGLLAAGADDVVRLPDDQLRMVARALAARRRAEEPDARPLPYRAIFEHNPLIMAVVEEETLRFLAVSDGAISQYGWSREEFLQRTLYDVRPPELAPILEDALRAPDPSFLTSIHRKKDGSEFISQGVLQKVEIDGRRLRFAVTRDATREVRAAEEHRRVRADFQALVERSADGIFMHRRDHSVAYVNPAFASFLGYASAADLLGRNVLDLAWPEDREKVRARIEGIIASGESSTARPIRFLGRDGEVRWAETRGFGGHYGDDPVITVLARDLTERRKADEALRLSEERFERIFHASPACISLSRLGDGHFVDVNERFVQVTGFARAEVLGRTGTELGLWRDPVQREALYETLRRTGRLRDVEVALSRKTGEPLAILMSAEIVDLGGEACALVLATDLSEFKRVEAQLQHAHKMEAIGRLAGGIAHDFNNVLTGIRGYGEVLLEQLPAGSSLHAAAEHIQRGALRAASLASQLLVFTRRQAVEARVMSLNEAVGEMASLLRRIIGGDITLELGLSADLGRVRADPAQIEQVILNLAVNARDAMPAGGWLRIVTRDDTDTAGRAWVVLEVTDNGAGMSEEVRTRIFEPYFTTKEVGKGSGLGLSIVYGIVEQSGGTLRCESAPGRGTTFHIALPRVDDPVEPTAAPPSPGVAPHGKETVLVVEDDEDVRDYVQFVLGRAGYDVLVAENGQAALALSETKGKRVRLLLSDLVMPGMNGRVLADRWRALHPHARVLHMSGYPGNKSIGAGTEVTEFLQKPFSAEELLQRVRAMLDDPSG